MVTREELIQNGFRQYKRWGSILHKECKSSEDHSMLLILMDDHIGVQFQYRNSVIGNSGNLHKQTVLNTIEEVNDTYNKFCELIK